MGEKLAPSLRLAQIPPEVVLSLSFDADRRGPAAITVVAVDADGMELSRGNGDATLQPSSSGTLTVSLGVVTMDMVARSI